mmetsp:Transcript_94887/g.171343  ORF Transcript_94887/g.171343 Transcript_94887/m.171343 type:complete len:307 (+) Transcript_94887:61-981(+)
MATTYKSIVAGSARAVPPRQELELAETVEFDAEVDETSIHLPPEKEGFPSILPQMTSSQPSDRAARRRALESRLRAAHEQVSELVQLPMAHGRTGILGLVVLAIIRIVAWVQGNVPGYSVFCMHFLTSVSDVVCIICTAPLFVFGTRGYCVQKGCLGPMLTLVFAMCMVDLSAFGAYLLVATPRPLAPGSRSIVDVMEAVLGVWEWALLASVSLQLALCVSCWRVYRELRMAGLYAPDRPADVATRKTTEISVMEIMCEAEDIEYLQAFELKCEGGAAEQYNVSLPLLSEAVPDSPQASQGVSGRL